MAAHGLERTRGVRWRTGGFEMWCPDCDAKGRGQTFWPLTREFWDIYVGLQRCKACNAERKRRAEDGRRAGIPTSLISERNAAYYAANRERLRARQNARRRAKRRAAA